MIFYILYILVAACSVFCLVRLTLMHNQRDCWYDLELFWAVICGIFWLVGAPIYAAYILAKLYADSQK